MGDSYRDVFSSAARAERYDPVDCAPRSYMALLWELEKQTLSTLVGEIRATHRSIDYLDFATGTGRIITFLEPKVDTATGIDVSEAMATLARRKLKKGKILCKDITADGADVEGKYDLITAFRFVLNAEPSLRVAALKRLAIRLKDASSRLIFNNHSNPFSHKMVFLPYHKLWRIGRGFQPRGIYMSNGQARRLAAQAGLQIERVIGHGLLSGTLCKLIPFDRALRWEKKLAEIAMFQPFCCNQIYVAKLKQHSN